MTSALAPAIEAFEMVPGRRLAPRAARLVVGVAALALGGAILSSAPVLASPACSGAVMMADAIVLPDLTTTT